MFALHLLAGFFQIYERGLWPARGGTFTFLLKVSGYGLIFFLENDDRKRFRCEIL